MTIDIYLFTFLLMLSVIGIACIAQAIADHISSYDTRDEDIEK